MKVAMINWYFMGTFFCLNLSSVAAGAYGCRYRSVLSAICLASLACNSFSGFICKISASYSNPMPASLACGSWGCIYDTPRARR